jgi:hypothetical protein
VREMLEAAQKPTIGYDVTPDWALFFFEDGTKTIKMRGCLLCQIKFQASKLAQHAISRPFQLHRPSSLFQVVPRKNATVLK